MCLSIKLKEEIAKKQREEALVNTFGVAFGGQYQEIQRIVFGTDGQNQLNILIRSFQILNKYRDLLQEHLQKKGINEKLPDYSKFGDELSFYNNWGLNGFDANWGDFSEQNAIECVNFFVEIMIRSQQFSSSLPTVGGDVHLAIITKDKGFRFVSREEYEHEGYFTPIER